MKFKWVIFILIIIFLILFGIKYSGFSIQNTPSRITVDQGIIVVYDDFAGSTTNFLSLNDLELESIENVTLEIINYGKIIFNENINLTRDVVSNYLNLNNNINLSFNKIEINTSKLTSLEKPATLYLYDLTFSNPRILKNGEICPSTTCKQQSYSGGTLIFNVTNFSIYSAEEIPGIIASSSSGGGVAPTSNFILNKDLIKVSLKQGETKREVINITNTGQTILDITIKPEFVGKFMVISEDLFSLKPKESKIINIDIFATENEISGAYVGRIIINGGGITKIINSIIEIQEKKPLFDVSVDVISKEVNPGEQVEAKINVINKGDIKQMDILVYYDIRNFQGDILSFKEESIFIEEELNIKRKLRVLSDANFGAYVFYTKISHGDVSAFGTDVFMVSDKIKSFNIILIVLIIILIISIYFLQKHKKR